MSNSAPDPSFEPLRDGAGRREGAVPPEGRQPTTPSRAMSELPRPLAARDGAAAGDPAEAARSTPPPAKAKAKMKATTRAKTEVKVQAQAVVDRDAPKPGAKPGAATGGGSRDDAAYTVAVVDDPARWQQLGAAHRLENVFRSWGWGEYKVATGWSVERLRVDDAGGAAVAVCSVATKRKLSLRLLHIQGGPLLLAGDDDDERARAALEAVLAHLAVGRRDLVVVSTYYFASPGLVMGLLAAGFAPAVNSGSFTLMLDLSRGLAPVEAGLNRSWRRALRRSGSPLTARFPSSIEDRLAAVARFAPMYEALAQRKQFGARTSIPDLAPIVAHDPRWIILEVLDGEKVVAIRIAHRAGDLVTDWLAATTEEALRSSAGFFAMWSLVEHATALGAKRLDCGGIDPHRNPGVFRFKRGVTRDVRQSEPLWLYGRSKLLRNLAQIYFNWS